MRAGAGARLVWGRVGGVLVAVLLLAAGCSTRNPEAAPAGGDTLVLGQRSEPEHLSPILGYGADGGSLIFDGLVTRDADLSLRPALAAELPTTSPDGRTVTFTLRQGVTFHDGTPLTSDDVVFTYESILDEKVDSAIRGDLDAVASVEAPDDRTVVFRLKYPYAPLVQRTTIGVVPRHAFVDVSPNDAPFNTRPVGTGPYRFVSWTPGDKLQLEANPDYWGGAPATRRLVLAFAEDDDVRATRMAAGELDVTELPPKAAERFRGQAGLTVLNIKSADYRGIMFPFGNPVTADRAIRQALDLAVDRQAMVDAILAGAGSPAFGPVLPGTRWHNPAVTGASRGDPDAAMRVLEEAGWQEGPGGIRVKDGRPARFTLMYGASDALRKELALAVASDAKRVGVDVRVQGLDWDTIEQRLTRGQDALVMGWGSPYDPDYVNYNLFHSSYAGQGYNNPGSYRNPAVDQALDQGRRAGDEAERKRHYDRFQQLVRADLPWVHLVFLEHVYVIRGAWDGIQEDWTEAHEHETGGFLSNVHTWTPAA